MKPPHFQHCRYEVDGQVVAIAIDRPEVLDALHPRGHQEMSDAFDRYAAGGILGRRIVATSAGTQTNPGIAKALAQKAIDDDAFVVFGPAYSGSIMASMATTESAKVLPPLSAGK